MMFIYFIRHQFFGNNYLYYLYPISGKTIEYFEKTAKAKYYPKMISDP